MQRRVLIPLENTKKWRFCYENDVNSVGSAVGVPDCDEYGCLRRKK